MRQFLAAFQLDGARVAVLGEGPAAEAKARLFAGSPCELLRLDPKLSDEILQGALMGARLAFIAVEDRDDAQRLAAIARAAGALVNVVDKADLCDFQTPALIDRGEVVVGIATGGVSPVLARDLRARIEALLPAGLDRVAKLARDLRDAVKLALPDYSARRRFWERALRGPAARFALAGQEAEARREVLRALNRPENESGLVQLVGAGPGDPDLLTLKALRALQDADVIVHDRLVSAEILGLARRDARRLYVGKAASHHSVPQDQIEALLIAEARAGRRVVRLKGGDPFMFGRGGEELEALRAAGVEAEVIPGVTAALVCAASIGAPLTHRDHAHAVTFLTGRPKAGGADIDWAALSAKDHTLAIYMGAAAARDIEANLLAAGRARSTPVAVVENGGLASERVALGHLHGLADLVSQLAPEGPALLLIGPTAAFAQARREAFVRREFAA
jgi:uroporphyrin-III C-methyltransferase/precorrin-2 dehydrogenase/sirohydrochlorin ferrochelatase